MDEKLLISFGLTQNQARAYRALILKKSLRPTQLSKLTGESRTNCYAILDKLVELGLAIKADERKKLTYYPSSPTSLKLLLSKQLNSIEEQLSELDRRLPQMLSEFHAGGQQPKVKHYKGKKELADMYIEQLEQPGRELTFLRTLADIPYFGYETMRHLRGISREYKKRRVGITQFVPMYKGQRADVAAGGLKRSWIKPEEYTAPVEWAVSGNQVQAILLKDEGYGISINHPEIADSFRQILKLLSEYIKKSDGYDKKFKTKPKTSTEPE